MKKSIQTIFKSLLSILIALLFCAFLPNAVFAKIEVNVDRTYKVTPDLEMQVEEVQSIFNNTDNLYIPAGEQVEFEILGFKTNDPNEKEILESALKSLVLKRNNTIVPFNHVFGKNKLTIKTSYPANFYPGAQTKYVLSYKHPGLIYKNGALTEGYIHAFGPDFKFELANTKYSFNTKLVIPQKYETKYLIFPNPTSTSNNDTYITLEFEQSKLINQYVYLQLGKTQIYQFELTQDVTPTETKHTGLMNRYELIIPRNFKNRTIEQNIQIKSIYPKPVYIKQDEEKNIIGVFDFYSDITDKIIVYGYGIIDMNEEDFKAEVGQIKDIPREIITKYTQPSEFWEVNDPDIIKTAESLSAYNNNVYELTESAYKFIVDSIDYSQVKKFGLNERKGAVETLKGGAAVCMEYSDLFLTLMRARKIPTRAVFGYGYDPQKAGDQQEAHQWVQVYMPGLEYNWVDVDVTWGEGGSTLIGGDLNHFYTHFAYKNPNIPNVIARNSFGTTTLDNLAAPKINISAVDSIPNDVSVKGLDVLLEKYKPVLENGLQYNFRQFMNRYKAGFSGLTTNPDLSNSSQAITIITVFLLLVISLYILTPLYTYRKKKIDLK